MIVRNLEVIHGERLQGMRSHNMEERMVWNQIDYMILNYAMTWRPKMRLACLDELWPRL